MGNGQWAMGNGQGVNSHLSSRDLFAHVLVYAAAHTATSTTFHSTSRI